MFGVTAKLSTVTLGVSLNFFWTCDPQCVRDFFACDPLGVREIFGGVTSSVSAKGALAGSGRCDRLKKRPNTLLSEGK